MTNPCLRDFSNCLSEMLNFVALTGSVVLGVLAVLVLRRQGWVAAKRSRASVFLGATIVTIVFSALFALWQPSEGTAAAISFFLVLGMPLVAATAIMKLARAPESSPLLVIAWIGLAAVVGAVMSLAVLDLCRRSDRTRGGVRMTRRDT